ncbi:MAG: toll/interleukin-1 receptor domain-containing protein [Chloroflexota bacterium]
MTTSVAPVASHREAIYSAPLGPIRRAADEYTEALPDPLSPEDKPFDCFICYAIPDEEDVVAPLVELLRDRNLTVWAGLDLTIGSPLGRKIDQGLRASRFGVVVLSPAFFDGGGWRKLELDALMGIEARGSDPVILPIWHNVTAAEVAAHSPILAGKLGRSTATQTLEQISEEIAEVARI